MALGHQGGAGQAGQLLAPDPVALVLVASGEPGHVVAVAAERVGGSRRVVLGQQGTEHRLHRPAVRDNVVHGLHQGRAAVARADEREAHQRPGGEVEARPAVLFGEVAEVFTGDAGPVQDGEARAPAALDDGDDPAVVEGGEAGGEGGVEREEPVGGGLQPFRVHLALQADQLLLDVGAGGLVVEDGVEVEALLERGERQDVEERRAVEGVHVRLDHLDQREVAGCVAASVEGGQGGEGGAEVVAEDGDVVLGEHAVGPGDGGDQFVGAVRAGIGDRVELQGARQPHARIAPLAQLSDR